MTISLRFLLIVMSVLVVSFGANASVYQVNDVTVEFKRFNSQKIRSYAVDVATKRGFSKLLKNIVPQEYNTKEIIESIDLKKTDVVEKLNIVEEVNTKGRYYAKFDILYNQKKIKEILQEKRIPFTQKSMGKVLVLPIQQSVSSDLLLFEDSNKFKSLLLANLEDSLLIEPVLAKGDLQEITTYNPQNVLDENNKDKIIELATKYETNKSLIVLLEQNNYEEQSLYQVTIKYINFDDLKEESFIVLGKTLSEASKEVATKIVHLWQQQNLIELNKPKRFVAMIETGESLETLNGTIAHLKTLSMVSSVKITQLTTRYAFVQTDFYGTPQEFLDTAKNQKLNIFQSENRQWMIERVLD